MVIRTFDGLSKMAVKELRNLKQKARK